MVLREALVHEDLQKGEKLIVFDSNNGIKAEEGVKVEEER